MKNIQYLAPQKYKVKHRKRKKEDTESNSENKVKDYDDMLSHHVTRYFKIYYLFKLVIIELVVFLLLFYAIRLIYVFVLKEHQQKEFDQLVVYFNKNLSSFGRDITFLLGFYVAIVAKRWWDQYRLLPWPDNLAMTLTGKQMIHEANPQSRPVVIIVFAHVISVRLSPLFKI